MDSVWQNLLAEKCAVIGGKVLDIQFIRDNPEKVKRGTKLKGIDAVIVDRVLKVDETRRQLLAEVQKWRQLRNKLSKDDVEQGKRIKEMLRRLEPDLRAVEEQFKNFMYQIPNLPAKDVPKGKDESENVVLRKWPASRRGATASRGGGKPKKFSFKPKDHLELGESLDIIDVKRAAKVSGSRFGYLKNEAVLLELALIQFAFDTLTKEGFIPIIPPVLIKKEIMRGMGYLEHGGEDDMYVLEKDRMVLVGTSEQSIGPMHQDEILPAKELPKRYVGFSTCFRREAGTYGKDTRGILRVHQFDKVEMLSYAKPEESDKEQEYLLSLEEKFFQALKIPHQVTKMCTGDLAHPQIRRYDIEAWIPAQNKYREVTSASSTTNFQSRRLNIKYRKKNKTEYVHTLNATGFAVGRTIIAILENYQQKDGSVLIPKVLQKYTCLPAGKAGFKKISPK